MSIDKSGKWWVGASPEDIREYLEAYSAKGYRSQEFHQAKCACGGDTFELLADDDEGCAKRICTSRGVEHFICDSAEYVTARNTGLKQRLKSGSASSAAPQVPISALVSRLYEDGEVRWLYVGERCSNCGILRMFCGMESRVHAFKAVTRTRVSR